MRVMEPNARDNGLIALEVTTDLGFADLTSATGYAKYREHGHRDQTDLLITLGYSYEAFPSFTAFTHTVGVGVGGHTAPTTLGVLMDTLCIVPRVIVAHPAKNTDNAIHQTRSTISPHFAICIGSRSRRRLEVRKRTSNRDIAP
jgi:hypothetical protein